MNGAGLSSDGLLAAEEIIDQRTVSELFGGRELALTTGRVLLHAVRAGQQALCGAGPAGEPGVGRELTLIGRGWDASYLPHVPRCRACTLAAAPGRGTPPPDAGP